MTGTKCEGGGAHLAQAHSQGPRPNPQDAAPNRLVIKCPRAFVPPLFMPLPDAHSPSYMCPFLAGLKCLTLSCVGNPRHPIPPFLLTRDPSHYPGPVKLQGAQATYNIPL